MTECPHLLTEPRRRKLKNGSEIIAIQCLNCGRQLKSAPKSSYNLATLLWFDDEIENTYLAEANRIWKEEKERQDEAQSRREGEWWDQYKEYLKSDHWRRVRDIVLNRDRTCQVCFSHHALEVHHLTYQSYNNVGVSFAVECVGVCGECHDRLHGKGALYGFA